MKTRYDQKISSVSGRTNNKYGSYIESVLLGKHNNITFCCGDEKEMKRVRSALYAARKKGLNIKIMTRGTTVYLMRGERIA